MGMEKRVDITLSDEGIVGRHHWDNGLCCDPDAAAEIIEALEESSDFGPCRYNANTGKIEFGVHYMHMRRLSPEQYGHYVDHFKSFKI